MATIICSALSVKMRRLSSPTLTKLVKMKQWITLLGRECCMCSHKDVKGREVLCSRDREKDSLSHCGGIWSQMSIWWLSGPLLKDKIIKVEEEVKKRWTQFSHRLDIKRLLDYPWTGAQDSVCQPRQVVWIYYTNLSSCSPGVTLPPQFLA